MSEDARPLEAPAPAPQQHPPVSPSMWLQAYEYLQMSGSRLQTRWRGGEEGRKGQRFATTDKSLGHGEPTDARSPTHATTIINHPALVLVFTSISLAAITTTYTTTKILKRALPHPSRLLPSSLHPATTTTTASLPHNTTTPPRVSPRFVRARRRPTQKP
ncbi:uncharacterized protein CLUP02_04461 [Colletotrichum lupini]|uniref:Uncharacterized protein n=1 Tax=Colletotrichum lupini TaxID=145971 RepID=A0A9Q8WDQ8_9PEZI|nr:uncharacterized protein CLUP02_04461 [Colletotrichum lupini]UQC78982.1 hypothetical protein CLUP02_04461 [Colletotrichum lupini]